MQKTTFIKNIFLLSFFIFLLSIISIKNYNDVVLKGLIVFTNCVLPSLFPYLVIVSIINGLNLTDGLNKLLNPITKKVFNTNGNVGVAFIISLISGYPVGAKIIEDLRENNLISETESIRGAVLCSTSSPAFLIATIGRTFYKNIKIGLILFLSQIICSCLLGIIFSFYKRKEKFTLIRTQKHTLQNNLIGDSIVSSTASIMAVGGTITIFFLLSELLFDLKILSPLVTIFTKIFGDQNISFGFTVGLIECTNGISFLAQTSNFSSICLTSFLCGFGGLSIICQSISFLKKAKIKIAPFFISKIMSAILNYFFTYFLCLIFL